MRDVFYIKDHGTCYLRNGVAPPYPCMMAWHTSGNDGYVRRARPAVIGIRGRPPSMAKPTSMDGGWELSSVLPGAVAAATCLFQRTYALLEG